MKTYLLTALLAIGLFLTGCAQQDLVMEVYDNDSADVEMNVTFDTSSLPFGVEEMREDLEREMEMAEEEGVEAEIIDDEEAERLGISIKKHITDVTREMEPLFEDDDFVTTYNDDTLVSRVSDSTRVIDMLVSPQEEAVDMGMDMDMIDVTFTGHFPTEPVDHNADSVDGNTLTWDIDYSQGSEVYAEYEVDGGSDAVVAYALALIMVAVVGIFIAVVVSRKRLKGDKGSE
ncbi:LppM family (lipo)protein [Texcoconibacillus texcoconensis]|uniref:DUF3153 domain-containing protein n=1 Tax=Texcoconibacillus texcoconensis TaxID=1095777 RepID=A0A840QQT1_9BACI|nr:hypothetical protein [Texcoconibacillus texcoconensis]MBB5173802.1 hypothetical protein [Texcoconibacillus texcoconensis]